jgi:hypothetical protein
LQTHNRYRAYDLRMFVDSNFFWSMIHYAPEMLLLIVFGLVGVAGAGMYKSSHRWTFR